MKLAIAAFSTALVLATGASAMVGPYERAVNDAANNSDLITTGMQEAKASNQSTSPQAEWSNGEVKEITVFSTKDEAGRQHFGAGAR